MQNGGGLGLHFTDCDILRAQIKHQEKQLALKRRWLMGLPFSKSEKKHFEGPKNLSLNTLPESFLREDDLFYERLKVHVEEACGVRDPETECSTIPDSIRSFDTLNEIKYLQSHLNDLTNEGLYHFAMIVAGDSARFDKTRSVMRKVIKESLPKVIRAYQNNEQSREMSKQLYQLMSDPHNFRVDCPAHLASPSKSLRTTAIKILDRLENFPSQVLIAMHRKLKGMPLQVPRLQASRCGRNRDELVRRVRKTSTPILSKLGMWDMLPDRLAKAMAIATVSLKLLPKCEELQFSTEFCQFSPEIKCLQDDIVKAVRLLKKKVRFRELKRLQGLLDPESKVPNHGLRNAVVKMLTDYLLQCSELDVVPDSLLEALAVINRDSRAAPEACFSNNDVEADVDCILNVSAQMKQVLLDSLPENGYYKDFANAYVEELKESDDEDDSDESSLGGESSDGSDDYRMEGFGDSTSVDSHCPNPPSSSVTEKAYSAIFTPSKLFNSAMKTEPDSGDASAFSCHVTSSVQYRGSNLSKAEMDTDEQQDLCSPKTGGDDRRNLSDRHKAEDGEDMDWKPETASREDKYQSQYLAIQEVCDKTSMVAYNLIGSVLEGLARTESSDLDFRQSFYLNRNHPVGDPSVARKKHAGLDEDLKGLIMLGAIEKQIPSIKDSVMKRVKEVMDLR